MADSPILPLPQKHQTNHNHSCYGYCNHQQANQCTAAEVEILSQGTVGLLTGTTSESETRQKQNMSSLARYRLNSEIWL